MINGLIQGSMMEVFKKSPPWIFFAEMHVKMKIPPLLIQNYFKYKTEMEIY